MRTSKVFRIPMSHPGDVSGLKALFDKGTIAPNEVVAILGKTEGNGCVNDFTRGYSTFAFQVLLAETLKISREEVAKHVAFVMSGGTEGVLSPHANVFVRSQSSSGKQAKSKRLSIGVSHTREFQPEELGRVAQVNEVARATKEAVQDAGIDSMADVHFVQIKCPLLTSVRIDNAHARGKTVVTHDTYESMGYSRGASALGVGVALGEIMVDRVIDGSICKDWSLSSAVASTSAGIELMNCEIIVMGNAAGTDSEMVIGHSVMRDAIDSEAVREALRAVNIPVDGIVAPTAAKRIVNVFAKAEADPSGYVRNVRHTMLNDSDINNTRAARAVVGAVIASVVGDPMVYVSGGAEHQGPAGGGPIAIIARL
ncbi:MAG: ring-opening amidohydrolase [Alphaproteobacteria bacterium]|nr:ring-opening amidohydrolase [Alphaproteobacteria bacterium]